MKKDRFMKNKRDKQLPPLNWLRAFEASARLGSFTAAAEDLHITQSAVSQQIRLLESHMQEALFFREGRKLRLTEAGQSYIYFVREAFDLIRTGTATVFDEDRGRSLTLRSNLAFTLFWLMPRLSKLYKKHPWINLNILPHIWDNEKKDNRSAIEIMVGINFREKSLRPLGEEEFFPVCSPSVLGHDLNELPQFDSSTMSADWSHWHDSGLSDLTRKPINYATTLVVSLTAAANGAGLALSHTTLAEAQIANGSLVRPFEGRLPMQERYFITELRQADQTPATQAFLDWIEEERSA